MSKTIFISGPMRGYPNRNRQAFAELAGKLRSLGYDVVNPAEAPRMSARAWEDWAVAQLERCQAAVFLKGYQDSKGSMFEYHMARATGLPVIGDNHLEWLA